MLEIYRGVFGLGRRYGDHGRVFGGGGGVRGEGAAPSILAGGDNAKGEGKKEANVGGE